MGVPESQIDMMAAKVGMDPVEFRLKNLKDPRMIRTLKAAKEKFGWKATSGPSGKVVGVALPVTGRAGDLLDLSVGPVVETLTVVDGGIVLVDRVGFVDEDGSPAGVIFVDGGTVCDGGGARILEQTVQEGSFHRGAAGIFDLVETSVVVVVVGAGA